MFCILLFVCLFVHTKGLQKTNIFIKCCFKLCSQSNHLCFTLTSVSRPHRSGIMNSPFHQAWRWASLIPSPKASHSPGVIHSRQALSLCLCWALEGNPTERRWRGVREWSRWVEGATSAEWSEERRILWVLIWKRWKAPSFSVSRRCASLRPPVYLLILSEG